MTSRYVLDGITADMAAGKHVGLMGVTRHAARAYFETLADRPGWAKVRRANGVERIDHESGGTLRLFTPRQGSVRGATLDVLVLLDFEHLDHKRVRELLDEVRPTAAEIVRS